VEATVRGQSRTVTCTLGSALRIQPGFSGSPVYDRGTGRIVGLLSATPPAASGERDSYAITVDRLRLAWPEVLDPRHAQAGRRADDGISELTILHVSDPQFGRHHLFGGNGLTPADQAHDTLFQRLHDDLNHLAENHGLRPDLMVVTGDLAEWGLPSEFEHVVEFLTALTEAAQLSRRQVAIVPGNHDVNRKACAAYFQEQEADEHEPGTLFEMPNLAVAVAGLNSTVRSPTSSSSPSCGECAISSPRPTPRCARNRSTAATRSPISR
jgi:Calcineurin-like phosphoesterase